MDHRPNVSMATIKFSEKNVSVNLHDLKLGNSFLAIMAKAQFKIQVNQALSSCKNFFVLKDTKKDNTQNMKEYL